MAAGSIIVDLLMKTGSFETDTKRAEKRLAELKKEAQAMGVAVGAAFAAVGVASVAMVKSAIDAADAAGETAQKVGLTVEQYTALEYAAKLGAVSQDVLSTSLIRLSRNMIESADKFEALGISVKNADGSMKNADQMLGELANKFSSMPDGMQKTADAVDIFGKSGADLLPFLNLGAEGIDALKREAQELGLVLSTETSNAAGEFNDNLDRMSAAVTGVANRAAGELLPALNDVSSMLVDVAKNEATVEVATDIVKTAVGGLVTVMQAVAVIGSDVGFVFKGVGRELGALAAQAEALGVGLKDVLAGPAAVAAAMARAAVSGEMSFSRFSAISDAVKADGERARAELDKFQARVMNLGQPTARDPRLLGDVGSIASQTAGWGRSPGRSAAAGAGPSGRASADRPFNGLSYDEQITQSVGRLFESSDLIRARVYEDTLRKIDELYFSGAINADLYESAVAKLSGTAEATGKDALPEVTKAITETKSMTEELGMTFSSAFEDAALGGGKLSDVFKGLLQDIARVILRMQVIEPMMKQLKASMDGGGGMNWGKMLFGALGGAMGGGMTASFAGTSVGSSGFGTGLAYGNQDFGGYFADGGNPPVGKMSIVGERGPELFIPRTAGTILPNHMMGRSSGGEPPIIINQTQGRIDNFERQDVGGREAWILKQAEERSVARIRAELAQPSSRTGRTLRGTYDMSRKF